MTTDELTALRQAFPADVEWAYQAAAAMREAMFELDEWTWPEARATE